MCGDEYLARLYALLLTEWHRGQERVGLRRDRVIDAMRMAIFRGREWPRGALSAINRGEVVDLYWRATVLFCEKRKGLVSHRWKRDSKWDKHGAGKGTGHGFLGWAQGLVLCSGEE